MRLNDIVTVYENPDILLEASRIAGDNAGRNIAVGKSVEAKVLTFDDLELRFGEKTKFVSGRSYALSFREFSKIIFYYRSVVGGGRGMGDLTPGIISALVRGKDVKRVLEKKGLGSYFCDLLNRRNGWLMKELETYAKVCRMRLDEKDNIDSNGLVLLRSVAPITVVDDPNMWNLQTPFDLSARKAEFRFSSSEGVKIADGSTKVGTYEKALLTFDDLRMHLYDEKIGDGDFRSYDSGEIWPNIVRYASGGVIGGLLAKHVILAANGYSSIDITLLSRILTSFTIVASGFGYMYLGSKFERKKLKFDARGSSFNFAFYGLIEDEERVRTETYK